jgi:hypothetical protein
MLSYKLTEGVNAAQAADDEIPNFVCGKQDKFGAGLMQRLEG